MVHAGHGLPNGTLLFFVLAGIRWKWGNVRDTATNASATRTRDQWAEKTIRETVF
jgi:hypothetical protein